MSLLRFSTHDWKSDEQWNSYLSTLDFPDGISQEKLQTLHQKYQRKFYSEKIEPLPLEPTLTSYTVMPTEKHTATDQGKGWSQIFKGTYANKYPHVKFIFPNAGNKAITINNGYVMPAWFDVHGFSIGSKQDEAGILVSSKILHNYIDIEVAWGIGSDRIIVGGFSQGGAIATVGGLTYPAKLAGVLGMSTFCPMHDKIPTIITDENKKIPMLVCHGTGDQIISFSRAQLSYSFLQSIRKENLEWKEYEDMGHTSCSQEMIDVGSWFDGILNK